MDLAERQLTRDRRPIPLTPKVFQTLEILLRNRDRIVSKQELLSTIWPESHVEESNLTQNISVLRKALGETSSGTKFIATFPKQGYRFIENVEEDRGAAPAPVPQAQGKLRWVWLASFVLPPLTMLAVASLVRTEAPLPTLGMEHVVTHLPGRAFQPALSPDGRRVAFTRHQDLSGPLRIAVLDQWQSSSPYTVPTGDGDAFSPTWSPDGLRLAYLRASGGRISVVLQDPDGIPEPLTDIFPESRGVAARQLDWSPDGRFLAVAAKSASGEPFRIELIHIAEKRHTVLTTPPELSDGDFQPRFSPDGSKLAFVRQRSIGEMHVMFVSIPGGDPVSLSDNRDPCGDVDWTPDSHSVVFTPQHLVTSQLCQAPIASGGKPAQCLAMGGLAKGMLQFSVSRQTGRLILAHAQPDQNIWRAELQGGQPVRGWERLIASSGEESAPTYSPDSRRIAFLSDRSGDQQLWIKENDGRERQLTFGDLKPGSASWTGNNDEVVFPALRKRILYRMNSDGSSLKPIPIGEVGSHTAVSPDGAWVYLVRRFFIMMAPSAGGTPTQVTDQGGFPLRLSRDGTWIYYVRHRFSSEIWRVRRADGFTERMTNRLQPGCWGCWSVNDRALVYVPIDHSEAPRLERMDLATGEVRDLGRLPGRLFPPVSGMLTLSADDHWLAAVVAEPGTGDLQAVEGTPWSRRAVPVSSAKR